MSDVHFVEDFLDDKHWTNVQDPIKHMFLSLSKAIRIQSAGIRDLDSKCSNYVTIDSMKRYMKENIDQTCSKQDATQLIYQLETKVNDKEFRSLEYKFQQMQIQMDKLTQQSQQQQTIIEKLTTENHQMNEELEKLSKPNYDVIFNFLQKHLMTYSHEIEQKLIMKADKVDTDSIIPKKLEDLYVNITTKLQDLKFDVQKNMISKDSLTSLLQTKVDRREFQDFCFSCKDYMSKSDLTPIMNNQVKPLMIAMTSLEKAIQIQEAMNKEYHSTVNNQLQSLNKTQQDITNSGLLTYVQSSFFPTNNVHFQQQLTNKIEDILQEKYNKNTMKNMMESFVNNNNEYLLKQVNMLNEGIRLEITTLQREELDIYKLGITTKVQEHHTMIEELSEKNMKIKKSLKELSLNIAKSLSKKLDIKDFKTILKNRSNELSQLLITASTGTDYPATSETIIQTSRDLMHSSRKGTRNENSDAAYASSSDPNREFDYLIQSMKKRRDKDSSSHQRPHSSSDDRDDSLDDLAQSTTGSRQQSPVRSAFGRSQSGSPSRLSVNTLAKKVSRPQSTSKLASRSKDDKEIWGGNERGGILRSSSKDSGISVATGVTNGVTVTLLKNEIHQMKDVIRTLTNEVAELKATHKFFPPANTATTTSGNVASARPTRVEVGGGLNANLGLANEVDKLDWRIALGEVAMNLRRELADKATREELYSIVRTENDSVENRLAKLEKEKEKFSTQQQVAKLDSDFQALRSKVSSELTGARFLWTTGQLIDDGWISWDSQIINVAPSVIVWKKNTTNITVRVPGLYRICLAVFTLESTILQIYVNNEPIFSLQPELVQSLQNQGSVNILPPATASNMMLSDQKKENQYHLQRFKHSIGEVSCLHIDEYVSLPPECTISVRYYSSALAQGFLSINKM